jgi:hypothetical protein
MFLLAMLNPKSFAVGRVRDARGLRRRPWLEGERPEAGGEHGRIVVFESQSCC